MLFKTIFLLGAIHGLVLAVLLAGKKVNRLSNKIMGVLMLVFSIDLGMAAFLGFGQTVEYPFLLGLDFPITLLYAPLIYLYSKTLMHGQHSLKRSDLIHLIPFALLLLYTIPFYMMSSQEKLSLLNEGGGLDYGPGFITHIKVYFNIAYIPFIIKEYLAYRQRLRANYSSIEERNLSWLGGFFIGFLILAIISAGLHLLNSMSDLDIPYMNYTLLAVTIFVYSIGYMGLRQPEFFVDYPEDEADEPEVKEQDRYSRSGLSKEEGQKLMDQLSALMAKEKPYQNNELSLRDLAGMMHISTHYLTEIINRYAEKNFYEFINYYRVEEVKEKIQDSDFEHFTLLSLGLDAGFNSKSSFNSVFKKQTGMTPSEYKKSLN